MMRTLSHFESAVITGAGEGEDEVVAVVEVIADEAPVLEEMVPSFADEVPAAE